MNNERWKMKDKKTFDFDLTGAQETQTSSFGKWDAILQIYGWGWVPRGPVTPYRMVSVATSG